MGITVSRICTIPASMDDGSPSMVVVLAYTICLLLTGQRHDGAAVALHRPPLDGLRQWVIRATPRARVAGMPIVTGAKTARIKLIGFAAAGIAAAALTACDSQAGPTLTPDS